MKKPTTIPAIAGRITTVEKKLDFHEELFGLMMRAVLFPAEMETRVKLLSRLGIVEERPTLETTGESDGDETK